MDYFKYDIKTGSSENEVLIALLSEEPFDTFVENKNGFDAFLPVKSFEDHIDKKLDSLQERFGFSSKKEFIPAQNWNKKWESNFHPIEVGSFCGIRADFHAPLENVEHEIVITPKMAFGTGHHETTYMVIQLMKSIDFSQKSVLDFGCGTGVLAILASKLGAASTDAVDIEFASWENTLENCETNDIKNVNAYQGGLGMVTNSSYGIVLANINRNVILDSLASLSTIIKPGGILVLSGILKKDQAIMQNAITENGFLIKKIIEKNKWLAMQCING